MAGERIQVSRLKVGLIAAALLVGALVVWIAWPEQDMLLGGLVRVGALMSALWIAMPGGGREAAWANISKSTMLAFAAIVLAVVLPRFRVMLFPILVAIGVLGYLARQDPERPSTRPDRDR